MHWKCRGRNAVLKRKILGECVSQALQSCFPEVKITSVWPPTVQYLPVFAWVPKWQYTLLTEICDLLTPRSWLFSQLTQQLLPRTIGCEAFYFDKFTRKSRRWASCFSIMKSHNSVSSLVLGLKSPHLHKRLHSTHF